MFHQVIVVAKLAATIAAPLRCLDPVDHAGRPSTVRKASRPGNYPIRKVTTPVPVAGGVAGGALAMIAGTSFHGRKKPNGSACQRRTMAGVQDEAKHAMRAMSPLKSCEVEKPQPQR
jgi:hypothetical protein